MAPAWDELRVQIRDPFVRWRLSSFMRFCSANGIAPPEVDERILERFKGYRARSGTPADDRSGRRLARAWNSNVGNIRGWPARRLQGPAVKPTTDLPWEELPERFRRGIESYPQALAPVRKSRASPRTRPLNPPTLTPRAT